MTRVRDMNPALARAWRNVPEERVASEPDVAKARRVRDERERARTAAGALVRREVRHLARLDAELVAARDRLEQLEGDYPSIAARVFLGEVKPDVEADLLAQIDAARQIIRRCEAARPVIDTRLAEPRRHHARIAAEVAEAEEGLARAIHVARERLAREALGRA